ncbi:MAG TPA: sugar phosphate nucleotidyltransferase [Methylomirabilota bacterium]|nr:sugar phosphate nucleotidyltransferase [Methylomirabilota bacterium]
MSYSAIVLAGGDGTRLQALTRALAGDDRPKQFCRILGYETLLEQTRRRALMLVDSERLLTVVTHRHERFYAPLLADAPPQSVIVQPENRGTATAIVLALRCLHPEHPVIVLPSDHYVSDDAAFMARVEGACEAVLARPDLVVLLGIAADRPEVEFGWIEPGALILGAGPWPLYRVARFREKPGLAVAARLVRQGGLWNSFVLVARASTLTGLIRRAVPGLVEGLAAVPARLGRPGEDDVLGRIYAGLPSTDFSRHVLQRYPEDLAVLPVTGLGWNDLGDPGRVLATRARARSALVSA